MLIGGIIIGWLLAVGFFVCLCKAGARADRLQWRDDGLEYRLADKAYWQRVRLDNGERAKRMTRQTILEGDNTNGTT